jgi:hypothetical protein
VQPVCGRCVKAGASDNCLYIEDSADHQNHEVHAPRSIVGTGDTSRSRPHRASSSGYVGSDMLDKMNYRDGRSNHLETALAMANARASTIQPTRSLTQMFTPNSATGVAERAASVQEREVSLLRGRNFKSQYLGTSHIGASVGSIPGLTEFSREAFSRFPALIKAREDLNSLKSRSEHPDFKHTGANDTDLLELLPSQRECSDLVKAYFDNFGALYQVLHPPAFWTEFDGLWLENAITRPHFIALVLCMTACARCVRPSQPWLYIGKSAVPREQSIAAIRAVQTWVQRQSQKQVSAEDFQIRFLLLLAKQVAAYKSKRTWGEAGEFLRFCIAAGLHRDPDMLRKPTSALDKELRKRVWASITEFELQAAFDKGMPSASWISHSDCPPPSHVSDDDWQKDPDQMPPAISLKDFSGISFLTLAAESIALRTAINTALNRIRQNITFEEVRRYTDEVEHFLKRIPDWPGRDGAISSAMLTLNLQQFLLTLHERRMHQCTSNSERDYSQMVAIQTAASIISTHRSLSVQGYFALEVLRTDYQRASLVLCSQKAAANPNIDDGLSTLADELVTRNVPVIISVLTERVYRLGCDQRQLWMLSALFAYAQSKYDPDGRSEYMQNAVDRVLQTYYKIVACQDETAIKAPPSGRTRHYTSQISVSNNGIAPDISHGVQIGHQDVPAPDFNFDELVGWTFDDFPFMSSSLANDPFFGDMTGP